MGFRAISRSIINVSSATRLLTSHPDWDLKALNDEMEGLIGKFDVSADGSTGVHATVPSSTDTSGSSYNLNAEKVVPTDSPPKIILSTKSIIQKEDMHHVESDKPSLTVFHFDQPHSQVEYTSGKVNLSHKYWYNFSSLDLLMEELAGDNNSGIIFLQNQFPSSDDIISSAQKNLLKIYKKSSFVVLVIGNNEDRNSATIDTSYASHIIQGFEPKDGIAAAIAGICGKLGRNV